MAYEIQHALGGTIKDITYNGKPLALVRGVTINVSRNIGKLSGSFNKAAAALRRFSVSTPIRSYSSSGYVRLPRKLKKRMCDDAVRNFQARAMCDKMFKKWICATPSKENNRV